MYTAINGTGTPLWLLFHCIPYDIPLIDDILLPTDWCGQYGNSFTVWEDHHDNWETTVEIFWCALTSRTPL